MTKSIKKKVGDSHFNRLQQRRKAFPWRTSYKIELVLGIVGEFVWQGPGGTILNHLEEVWWHDQIGNRKN